MNNRRTLQSRTASYRQQ